MNIVTALNKKYLLYTCVMLTSLCKNQNEHIDAYLLNRELDKDDFILLDNSMMKYDISIHDIKIDPSVIEGKVLVTEFWSIETYFRLFMIEELPSDLDRILYLDVDMIINDSIEEIYHQNIDEYDIVAAYDNGGILNPSDYSPKQQEMFAPMYEQGYRYFNAGMMLMNLSRLRKNFSVNSYLDAIEEWNYEMHAPDQDILNYVHWKNIGYIDCNRYNLFTHIAHEHGVTYEDVKRDAAILHFSQMKPWKTDAFHYDIEQLWWDYAKLTPLAVYVRLLEDFQISTVHNTVVEEEFRKLVENNEVLRSQLEKAMNILNKLQ